MRQQLEVAAQIGLRPSDFWRMTPGDFRACVAGYRKRIEQQLRIRDQIAWMGGNYIGFAVNDPKKYPKKPFLQDVGEEQHALKPMSETDMKDRFRAIARQKG